MVAYICDYCEEVIPYKSDRYLIKVVNAAKKHIPANTICLCGRCKKTWAEHIPALFAFDDDEEEE